MRVLMSDPRYLPALSPDRVWGRGASPLDPVRAHDQWTALRAVIADHVGPVVTLPPEPWAPAMTFTRDLGCSVDGAVVPLVAHLRRGAFEAPLAAPVFDAFDVPVLAADEPIELDGGNLLVDHHGRLLVGAVADDDPALTGSARTLARLTGLDALRVPIAGGRFPHLDMAVCDLAGRAWVVHPAALPGYDDGRSDPAWRELWAGRPVVEVDPADGDRLACNLVVTDDGVIGPSMSDTLARRIESFGFGVERTDLDECIKAGGGAHCLTLELPEPVAGLAAPTGG